MYGNRPTGMIDHSLVALLKSSHVECRTDHFDQIDLFENRLMTKRASSPLLPKSCALMGSVYFKGTAFPKSTMGLICGIPFPFVIRVNRDSIEQRCLLGLMLSARNAS